MKCDFNADIDFAEAIVKAEEAIKLDPNDLVVRSFLVELLCITGDLERADRQLDLLKQQHPKAAVGIVWLRQLIRAAQQRRDCFTAGLVPKFPGKPTSDIESRLRAVVELQVNNEASASKILMGAEMAYCSLCGMCNGKPFKLLRDLDDICAHIFEIFTHNGEYYWLPMESVKVLKIKPPIRPLDLVWRTAYIESRDGLEGEVYLPAIYHDLGDKQVGDPNKLQIGRQTLWRKNPSNGLVQGMGQRMFLVGESAMSMLEIDEIIIN